MKLGTKSNLISAYSALFTVAFGLLTYDSVRRAPLHAKPQIAQKPVTQQLIADSGKAGTNPVH